MGTPTIVVSDPHVKDSTEMSLAERDHEVQALAAQGADQTFTERIRLRNANRRLEYHQTHGFKGPVDLFRVNRVAIVDHEPVRVWSPGTTIRNCCAVHSAVGCAVTFPCTMRRVPTSRTTNT